MASLPGSSDRSSPTLAPPYKHSLIAARLSGSALPMILAETGSQRCRKRAMCDATPAGSLRRGLSAPSRFAKAQVDDLYVMPCSVKPLPIASRRRTSCIFCTFGATHLAKFRNRPLRQVSWRLGGPFCHVKPTGVVAPRAHT